MENKEPTEAQIEEFWEWRGFKRVKYRLPVCHHTPRCEYWRYPGGKYLGGASILPPIDLNNLFKYAVPEVMERNQNFVDMQVRRYIAPGYNDFLISYTCEIWSDNGQGSIIKQADTPALALFWAIWEVIHGE